MRCFFLFFFLLLWPGQQAQAQNYQQPVSPDQETYFNQFHDDITEIRITLPLKGQQSIHPVIGRFIKLKKINIVLNLCNGVSIGSDKIIDNPCTGQIYTLPVELFELPELEELEISGDGLYRVQGDYSKVAPRLKKVSLFPSRFNSFDFWPLLSQVEEPPPEIYSLKKLKILNIQRAYKIIKFDDKLGQMASLDDLNLTGAAADWSEDLSGLVNLKSLTTEVCHKLESGFPDGQSYYFPHQLSTLPSLEHLHLYPCGRVELPLPQGGLRNLKSIVFSIPGILYSCPRACSDPMTSWLTINTGNFIYYPKLEILATDYLIDWVDDEDMLKTRNNGNYRPRHFAGPTLSQMYKKAKELGLLPNIKEISVYEGECDAHINILQEGVDPYDPCREP